MRMYIYLFVVGAFAVIFGGVFFQAPEVGAQARDAFLNVCEQSPPVRAVSQSVDKNAIACACIAAWHLKRAPAGTEPFYPNQLYILTGPEAANGLSDGVLKTDAKARAACIK